MSLTKKQISEIREHLEKAQNPLFLFDNDQDGLCSFLLLQRYIKRGKGFPVKNSRSSGSDYIRKINEFGSDYIFILDVPEFSEEFFTEVRKFNIPIVWIDHHDTEKKKIPAFANYYNPFFNKKNSNEPVTFLCWEIVKKVRKEDLWLGVIGCISDSFVPDFYDDFKKDNPELSLDKKGISAFDIFYGSEIGKISRILGFGLKDKTSNVIMMVKFLMKSKGPYDILHENKDNKSFHKRFVEIDKKYTALIKKAKQEVSVDYKFVFFKYAGDTSMSSEISNGLSYLFPKKYIFVAYTNGAKVNISARGNNVRDKVLNIIENLENATGGGHENAVGAQIQKEDLKKFEDMVLKSFN
jgi:single-stranded DNA-specific DHH superfamily exonuclease